MEDRFELCVRDRKTNKVYTVLYDIRTGDLRADGWNTALDEVRQTVASVIEECKAARP